MHIRALERVYQLRQDLQEADAIVQAFREAPPKVECIARVEAGGFARSKAVQLAPVDSAIAIAAAEAARQVIVNELASLGVKVD